jgi:hypothetical protein
MLLRTKKVHLYCHSDDLDSEFFPTPKIGIGWYYTWFYNLWLHGLKKELKYAPMFNLYIFYGNRYLTVGFEWQIEKENR